MQHTAKYNFKLIETSDTFSPDALNANTKAVETQLAALAALAAADAANKAALEKADAAADAAIKALNADVHPGAPGQIARIATGTYKGTGTNGLSGAYRLSFNFKPLLVFVFSTVEENSHFMMRPGTYTNGARYAPAKVIWEEQAVSWYVETNFTSSSQCNGLNTTYHYIAIGVPV